MKLRDGISAVLVLFMTARLSADPVGGQRRISVEEYRDKVAAAWAGKMIGVGWGITTEFRYSHRIVPEESLPKWSPARINEGFNQDDMYLSLFELLLLQRYGLDITARQASMERINAQFEYGGGLRTDVVRNRIAPPDSGHPHYKTTPDGCGYTCGADYSGIVAPGLPQAAVYFAERFGTPIVYGDGIYGGVFVGAMYSEAFFTSDVERIILSALLSIPSESLVSKAVGDVVAWHRESPTDWEGCWQRIMDKYWWNEENNWQEWPYGGRNKGINLDSKSMAAFSSMALLYGDGDLRRTLEIAIRASEDADCDASIAAGVLCASRGTAIFEGGDWLDKLDRTARFKYFNATLDSLCNLSFKIAAQTIERFGGRIESRKGKEYISVPKRLPDNTAVTPQSSKRPEPLSGSVFTDDEMAELEYMIDPGFENQSDAWSFFTDNRANHILPLDCDNRIERFVDRNARTGHNNAKLELYFKNRYPKAGTKIFTGVRQVVEVPAGELHLKVCYSTFGKEFNRRGHIRARSLDGEIMAETSFDESEAWNETEMIFTNTTERYIIIEAGFFGAGGERIGCRFDDFSLKTAKKKRAI